VCAFDLSSQALRRERAYSGAPFVNNNVEINLLFQTLMRGSRCASNNREGVRNMPTSTELRASAEAKFKKKELQRLDGGAAMTEYEAANRATMEKTARLRALRLSRDVAAPPSRAASTGKRSTSTRVRAAVSAD
jgi:hypothetical protein